MRAAHTSRSYLCGIETIAETHSTKTAWSGAPSRVSIESEYIARAEENVWVTRRNHLTTTSDVKKIPFPWIRFTMSEPSMPFFGMVAKTQPRCNEQGQSSLGVRF